MQMLFNLSCLVQQSFEANNCVRKWFIANICWVVFVNKYLECLLVGILNGPIVNRDKMTKGTPHGPWMARHCWWPLRGWSTAKKRWCCVHSKRGCDPYDCCLTYGEGGFGLSGFCLQKKRKSQQMLVSKVLDLKLISRNSFKRLVFIQQLSWWISDCVCSEGPEIRPNFLATLVSPSSWEMSQRAEVMMVTPTGENCGPCPRKLGVVNFVSDHLGWMMDEIWWNQENMSDIFCFPCLIAIFLDMVYGVTSYSQG